MFRDGYDRAYHALGRQVRRFVRAWRGADALLLRPLSGERPAPWQLLAPAGYPWFIPLLGAILVAGVTVGPRPLSGSASGYLLAALGLALMLGWHEAVRRSPWLRIRLLSGYLAILVLMAGLVIAQSYRDPSVPLHLGPGVALALTLMLAAASWVAGRVGRRVRGETMQAALPWVELFPSKDRGDDTGDTPGLALLSIGFLVLLRFPVQILLPPALVALVVPSGQLLWPCLATGVAAWAALVLGVLFDRLMEVLKTVGRLFFIGPQFVLSVLVILIAAGRWSGSHFINYLFDRPGGNGTVAWYIFFAYAVAWFYGFWCEILLTRRFIRVLAKDGARVQRIPYHFLGDERASRVLNAGRTIALHGAGRLLVSGEYHPDYRREQGIGAEVPARTFLTTAELLNEFRVQLEDKGWPPVGAPAGRDPVVRVRDLQRGILAFPAVSAALVLLFLGTPLVIGYRFSSQPPELDIVWDGHVNLPTQRLVLGTGLVRNGRDACPPLGRLEPRIAVAASGGGTRAAIYTAAVLRGLAMQDRICKVVLTSGVSGGSAALAYFALNQHRLRVPLRDYDPEAWDAFDAAMATPFIQEVLDAASESAVVFGGWGGPRAACGEFAETPDERPGGWWPARLRIGNLLAERFVCRMGEHVDKAADSVPGEWGMMKSVRFGLILNTGLAGRYGPLSRSEDAGVAEQARRARGDPIRRSDVAGGRLLLTNIPEPRQARRLSTRQGTRDLRFYTINDPEMSVARAAALSANFPPVFADAAIDERRPNLDVRFWVTDGGTVENRGTVTLYLAIQDAVAPRGDEPRSEREALDGARWPDLHLVVADVSAVGGPYEEGFGLGPLQWASSRMGLALEAELLDDLRAVYGRHRARLDVHELPMPDLLREAIGTHWMMPHGFELTNPSGGDPQRLTQDEALTLVSSLFTGPRGTPDAAVRRAWPWTCTQPPAPAALASVAAAPPPRKPWPHAEAWSGLMAAVSARDRSPCEAQAYASADRRAN